MFLFSPKPTALDIFLVGQLCSISPAVCEFHITSQILYWALGGGATNSPSHVLYMGVSYSC